MVSVKIDGKKIVDWDSFHTVCAEAFGFPDFYGKNMNAWIDCLTYLDDADSGMHSIKMNKGDFCVIEVSSAGEMKKACEDVFQALMECTAFVNFRNIEIGSAPQLMLSFKV